MTQRDIGTDTIALSVARVQLKLVGAERFRLPECGPPVPDAAPRSSPAQQEQAVRGD
jgi:hypothetical protein